MSYSQDDASLDTYLEELYQEHGPQWAEEHATELNVKAIQDFTAERMRSYYLNHPDMARAALGMIAEMEKLLNGHPIAALLFAASAIEITVKHLLTRPILSGLVHNEALADAVMELTPPQVGSDKFRDLFFAILDKVASVDLTTYKRGGSNKTLWAEYQELKNERNNLIHDGRPPVEALRTFDLVATEFLNIIFPKVLRELGLHVTGYLLISANPVPLEKEDEEQPI